MDIDGYPEQVHLAVIHSLVWYTCYKNCAFFPCPVAAEGSHCFGLLHVHVLKDQSSRVRNLGYWEKCPMMSPDTHGNLNAPPQSYLHAEMVHFHLNAHAWPPRAPSGLQCILFIIHHFTHHVFVIAKALISRWHWLLSMRWDHIDSKQRLIGEPIPCPAHISESN